MTDPLDIPDFLKREPLTPRKPRKTKKTTARQFLILPKSWAGAQTAFIEAGPPIFPARFPVGYRLVHYIVGRKFVRVREVVPTADCPAATAKLTKQDFERSLRTEMPTGRTAWRSPR